MSNDSVDSARVPEVSTIGSTTRTGGRWSEDEERLLRVLAGDHLSAPEIASRMARSSRAIGNQAFSLGVSYGRARKQRKAWGTQDDAKLVELAKARESRAARQLN